MENQSTSPKQAILERLGQSTNILVTVSANPSVDQLAACLGLTLWLNKTGKHATAVFSGDVPSTLEFLKPEDTLEKTTDSLRDFIISLDKSKADKLRYKVEDRVVKIFITPYRTSLSADDLEYSQGDFNVDMVIALGVSSQQDLDTAITAHGRILHDAAVATVTLTGSELGSMNWQDTSASSLSELVVDFGNALDQQQLDSQIATALLTGIVAETKRFSNEKTTPQTMSVSAQLMSAGANQQLVASQLEEPAVAGDQHSEATESTADTDQRSDTDQPAEPPKPEDGAIEITHETTEEAEEHVDDQPPEAAEPEAPQDQPAEAAPTDQAAADDETANNYEKKRLTEPPERSGTLTANTTPDDIMAEPSADPLTAASEDQQPLLERPEPASSSDTMFMPPAPMPQPTPVIPQAYQPAPFSWTPPQPTSPFVSPADTPAPTDNQPAAAEPVPEDTSQPLDPASIDAARQEVLDAINNTPADDAPLPPIEALNAQPIDLGPPPAEPAPFVAPAPAETVQPATFMPPAPVDQPQPADPFVASQPTPPAPVEPAEQPAPELTGPVDQPFTMPLPTVAAVPPPVPATVPGQVANVTDPTAPPPVPPPMMPPGFPPAK